MPYWAARLTKVARHLHAHPLQGQSYGGSAGVAVAEAESTQEVGQDDGKPDELEQAIASGKLQDRSASPDGYRVSEHLPGPLQDLDRTEVLLELQRAEAEGWNHKQWMQWQEQYGDNGLSSNLVVPHIHRERGRKSFLCEKVLLSDPDDCVRIARTHTQKEPNFQLFMGDSIISATDNTVWQKQRNHITEAFLPISSMAKIFPVSVRRASLCKDILGQLSAGGSQKVNMTEFFLNETQQQLHLALFGQQVRLLRLSAAWCSFLLTPGGWSCAGRGVR